MPRCYICEGKPDEPGYICDDCLEALYEPTLIPPFPLPATKVIPIAESTPHGGGTCVECGRFAPVLNDQGECEACHIQALMDRGLV